VFLSRILEAKRREVEERSARRPLEELRRLAAAAAAPRDFATALRRPGLGVIAEVKRASPSKGPIRPDLDPVALARAYELGGCAAISVLTDEPFFAAQADDLESVRAAVSVPVLRKDFLLSEYQLYEARAMGADAALLIVAALEPEELSALIGLAVALGMCPLVEVHTEGEVEAALEAGAKVVGINNRDLTTFKVDLETTRRLRPLVPPGVGVVAESGIATPEQAALVASWGVDAVLVGEALVASEDPAGLVRAMSAVRMEPRRREDTRSF
jgi:indole-3-glycerol phosphate synthase